jgi:hypothetical protein
MFAAAAAKGFNLPEISLTDFVDFVIKAGSPKLTKVRELVNREEYLSTSQPKNSGDKR